MLFKKIAILASSFIGITGLAVAIAYGIGQGQVQKVEAKEVKPAETTQPKHTGKVKPGCSVLFFGSCS